MFCVHTPNTFGRVERNPYDGQGRRRVYERSIVTDGTTTRVKRKHIRAHTIRKTCASVGVVTSAITTTAGRPGEGYCKKQKNGTGFTRPIYYSVAPDGGR